MSNEDARYDYVEETAEISPEAWRSLRRRKPHGPGLPVGMHQLETVARVPLQSYLRERFPCVGGKSQAARALRLLNMARHNIAASFGNWPMSRTS